jgi:hypothetical protein
MCPDINQSSGNEPEHAWHENCNKSNAVDGIHIRSEQSLNAL